MITERSTIDNITILEDGQMQVRRADIVYRDGIEIARNFHRHVLSPGQDVSGEDEKVRRVATVVHTKPVIDAYTEAALARPQLP
jgi:DNA polymerase elongation subunit (family B)